MAYQSKYTGLQIDDILDSVEWKQGKIEDLASIRAGAAKGATALQSYTEKYTGTVTGIKINGVVKSGSGVIDLGTIESKTLTESDIAAMGFTKNSGTYSKPSTGIPKSDLASAVQTSLDKADTALQSYTEQYKGTITGVAINGTAIATSGVAYIPSASTESYGTTKLNSNTNSTSTAEAATPSAVKAAYDLANGKQDKLTSGTNIKTINGQSLLGSGNITIDGGSGGVSQEAFDSLVNTVDNIDADVAQLTKDVQEKQDKLVSGTNIKTINGQSLLGGGDITIEGGGSSNDIYVFVVEDEYGTITEEEFNAIRSAKIVNINIGPGFDMVSVFKTDWSEEGLGIALAGTINYDSSRVSISVNIQNNLTYSVNYVEEIIPTFTSQLENDSNFVSSDNLKTINGESLIGEGDITISGGGGSSSGSGAYAEVNHGTSDTTFTLTSNTFHVWDEISALTLSLGDETAGVANEFVFQFTSGATPTSLTLPDSIKWVNDSAPTIAENKIYQISILNGLAVCLEFDNRSLVEMISFTVDGTPYQAPKDMTWQDFCNSEYNTYGFIIAIPNVMTSQYDMLYSNGGMDYVYFNEIILATDYTIHYNYGGVGGA